jgi:hypothetical protein
MYFYFKVMGEICENNVQKQDNEHKSLYQRHNVELGNCNFTWEFILGCVLNVTSIKATNT